ncbi:MAG: hypothetical protein U9N07_01635, partial [Euryarchaeota archaeon]|nr:hypothetical protein [Euryarchaeota archaeon]
QVIKFCFCLSGEIRQFFFKEMQGEFSKNKGEEDYQKEGDQVIHRNIEGILIEQVLKVFKHSISSIVDGL